MARTHLFRRTRLAAAFGAGSLWLTCFAVGLPAAPAAVAVPTAPVPVTGLNPPQTWGADLEQPVAFTSLHGQVWFADHGYSVVNGDDESDGSIGRITSSGYVENYPTNSLPTSITVGPDHNLWFGLDGGEVGRMTPAGKIKYFYLGNTVDYTDVTAIAAGPGGVWFDGGSDTQGVSFLGQITTKGKLRIYTSKAFISPGPLAEADGAMWIIDDGGQTDPQTFVKPYVVKFSGGKPRLRTRTTSLVTPDGSPAITRGPDGALWIADDHILRLSTSGKWTKYGGSNLLAENSIIVGPDKNLWFGDSTLNGATSTHVGVISTSGHLAYHRGSDGPLAFGSDKTLWAGNGDGIDGIGKGIEKISTKSSAHRTFRGGIEGPTDLVLGPHKALWFTNFFSNSIGRFVPGKGAVFYTSKKIYHPTDLVVGPDKAIWFTNTGLNTIGRIGSTTHKITSYHGTGIKAPWGITVGPDKALWFTNNGNNSIGRITTSGKVTNYPGGADTGQPEGITTGPDGALWYASTSNNAVDRMDPSSHVVTSYPNMGGPSEVVSAQGYVWTIGQQLVRISPSGSIARRNLSETIGPDVLGADSAGRIWFAWAGDDSSPGGIAVRATSTKVIYRRTAGDADGENAITRGPGTTMWTLSNLTNTISSITPKT